MALLSLAPSCLGLATPLRAAPPLASSRAAAVSMDYSKEELATALNPVVGYFDPLGLATADFWSQGNEATWGWLRHAEIKHGRVAMFAFVGYIAQYNGLHFGFPLSLPESPSYAAGLTPPEQWDALPLLAKAQIFTFIGFLEVCHRRSRTAAALSRPAPERRRPTRRPALCGLLTPPALLPRVSSGASSAWRRTT